MLGEGEVISVTLCHVSKSEIGWAGTQLSWLQCEEKVALARRPVIAPVANSPESSITRALFSSPHTKSTKIMSFLKCLILLQTFANPDVWS